MSTYRILFLGDIFGRGARTAVKESLPLLKETYKPLFTIVNGENAAGGKGITSSIASDFLQSGIDAITLGNHAFNKTEIIPFLSEDHPVVRPINMPKGTPGKGIIQLKKKGITLHIINLCGQIFMDPYDSPFHKIDEVLEQIQSPHIFVDFHAEATSEKCAMGWHLDGRVSAVVGTHTHVTTADERILPHGTAYMSDVGMSGPMDSVIGVDKEIILYRFLTNLPKRSEPAKGPIQINGVVIDIEKETGHATSIKRIRHNASL